MDSNQILSDDKDLQVLLVDGPKMCTTNPRWWTASIFKKSKHFYISATVWVILTKLGMAMLLEHLHLANG